MSETMEKNEEVEMQENEVMTEKTVDELEAEIEKLKKENDKYYEHLQRTAAEFDNYKKRVSKEKENIYQLAVGDVVAKYITVVDSLEKGVNVQGMDESMKEGINLIYRQILDVMNSLNVEVIPTVNEKFNPEFHDAVMHIESEEYDEQTVVEELKRGYKIKDRVIRPAMVKVAN
ncbi:MAG: nucleotide exchange factor GrpE [Clostridia bacterium]|nr:nucleotide exchange factor GrpE [Clostridia bacterium]